MAFCFFIETGMLAAEFEIRARRWPLRLDGRVLAHTKGLTPDYASQLRGEAGERQVSKRPEVGVISVGGGPIAGCMLLSC